VEKSVSRFVYLKQKHGSQPGFTLVEIVVALAVGAVILVGASALMYYMVVGTGEQSDQVMARLQVQYVSFWIGEDVVQAQHIESENSAGSATLMKKGFPLTITWENDEGISYSVIYDVENTEQNPWTLTREYEVNGELVGNSTVSQYLVPWSAQGENDVGTWCDIKNEGNETNPRYMVTVTAAAVVDSAKASGTYQINPREGSVTLVEG
jgi:prepilin-type N-terminal cleavage/methylation domain-containing protein